MVTEQQAVANVEAASAQEVFGWVATHLLEQRAKSQLGTGGVCLVRSNDGARACAIGSCLPNDPNVWGQPDSNSFRKLSLGNHGPLLRRLQDVHDDLPVRAWASALEDLADRFGLDMPGEEDE